jgi:hypothetical protein
MFLEVSNAGGLHDQEEAVKHLSENHDFAPKRAMGRGKLNHARSAFLISKCSCISLTISGNLVFITLYHAV